MQKAFVVLKKKVVVNPQALIKEYSLCSDHLLIVLSLGVCVYGAIYPPAAYRCFDMMDNRGKYLS